MDAVFAESARRQGDDGTTVPTFAMVATLFADVRVGLAGADSVRAAERWRPDVVVHESTDLVGPAVRERAGQLAAEIAALPTAETLAEHFADLVTR